MNHHHHNRTFALKFLKAFALLVFSAGTTVSFTWFWAFLGGLNPNLINSPQEAQTYSFSQGAGDFSKSALCYGLGLVSLYSAVKFEREINYLEQQSRLP